MPYFNYLDSLKEPKSKLDYENSQAYKESPEYVNYDLVSQKQAPVQSNSSGVDLGQAAAAGAGGAAAGGPVGAAVAVVGSLASQYLAQKAQDERSRRERAAQIAQQQGQDEQSAANNIMSNLGRALR